MTKHADPKSAEAEATALIKIEDITDANAPAIFGRNDLSRFVAAVRAEVVGEVPDLTTDKGRKRVASLAAKVARSKTALDGVGRAYLKKLKEMPKGIEAELREFIADMDALRDEVRKPLSEWEAEQEKAKAVVQEAIDEIVNYYTLPEDCDSQAIRFRIAQLEAPLPTVEVFGERLEEAEMKRKHGIAMLTEALDKRKKYESEQAELVESRRKIAEMEEQARIKAAADKAVEDERQRAAQQQEQDRIAAERRIQDAEQQARDAERQRQEAEQRAEQERQQSEQRAEQARLDEQRRQQEAADAIIRQQQEREANRAHCGAINKAALEALLAVDVGGDPENPIYLAELEAKAVITAIIRGQIPAVAISY